MAVVVVVVDVTGFTGSPPASRSAARAWSNVATGTTLILFPARSLAPNPADEKTVLKAAQRHLSG